MTIESQVIWIIIYTFTSCTIFYSMGHSAGKKNGYWRGRSVGIKMSQDREIKNG